MPHFTVVPVDGPRRGDYDNLEGLSWVDYGERAERDDSDGEGAPGWGLGGGREGSGPRGSAFTQTPGPIAHTSMRVQLFLVGAAAAPRQSLAPRAQTRFSWAPARPLSGRPPHPSSSLAGHGRGLQTWPTNKRLGLRGPEARE